MSRFDDGDESDIPYALWHANVERALKGKRGQQALREMRDALLALPEKKLIEGALCDVSYDDNDKPVAVGFCAVGALAFFKRVKAGEPIDDVLESLKQIPDDYDNEEKTIDEGRRMGLVNCLAYEFAQVNDDGLDQWRDTITDEERYTRYLAWVESKLAPATSGNVGE